jgi:hypothetical protein
MGIQLKPCPPEQSVANLVGDNIFPATEMAAATSAAKSKIVGLKIRVGIERPIE